MLFAFWVTFRSNAVTKSLHFTTTSLFDVKTNLLLCFISFRQRRHGNDVWMQSVVREGVVVEISWEVVSTWGYGRDFHTPVCGGVGKGISSAVLCHRFGRHIQWTGICFKNWVQLLISLEMWWALGRFGRYNRWFPWVSGQHLRLWFRDFSHLCVERVGKGISSVDRFSLFSECFVNLWLIADNHWLCGHYWSSDED